MPTIGDLRQKQSMPLEAKVVMTKQRIREWYDHFDGNVCVSFSGGKDSTVLAHLVHGIYPEVPLVFSNTGLEYPEIQAFAKKMGAEFIRPKMQFSEVITKYGYPIISKEVSEAIYYARRIREYNGKESERRRNQLIGASENNRNTIKIGEKSTEYFQRMLMGGETYPKECETDDYRNERCERTIKRRELLGKYVGGSRNETLKEAEKEAEKEAGKWEDWRRKQIMGKKPFDTPSPFNKSKWLKLCNETSFMIGHYCCKVMKKGPLALYQNKTHRMTYVGTLAEESRMRQQAWIKNGCNAYSKKGISQPLAFWTEQDILKYIKTRGLEIASVYGEIVGVDDQGFEYEPLPGCDCKLKCSGCQRTGCVFCGFGVHLDKGKKTKFQLLAETHPRQYEYCMGGGQWVDNPKYDPTAPVNDGDWKNWNPKKIWVPSKKGLGMKKVFDDCNQIYGKDFIRYE